MQTTKERRINYSIWIMAAISFLLLVIRSRYGFSYDDEPFLLTLTQRLYYGDSLFIDEWNFAQNVGVLLLPFYRIYIAIFGSVDGIVLVFRGVYCFFWVLTCTILYSVLRKKYKMAWVVYLYLLMFSPLDQMILSYTSIGLMCILLLGTLFFRHLEVNPMKLWSFTLLFSGLTIIAVIASPYLGFAYGLYVLGIIVFALRKRTESARFFMKSALWSVGIAVFALVLYVWRFMLNNYTIAEVVEKLPNMFATSSMGTNVTSRGTSLLRRVAEFWRYQFFIAGLTFLVTLVPRIRKSTICRVALLSANVLVFGYEMLLQLGSKGGIPNFNLQMIPIIILGYVAWWLLEEKKRERNLFVIYSVLGLCYAAVSYVSSDTGLPALAMGLTVCGVCAIVMIGELTKELIAAIRNGNEFARERSGRRMTGLYAGFVMALAIAVILSQLFVQFYLKIDRHYWDCSVPEMNAKITMGASKGVVTLEKRAASYDERMEALAQLLQYVDMEEKENIRFLSLIFDPDVYANAELPIGCYSTWTYAKTETAWPRVQDKMNRYYSVNPSKMPNVVFVSLIQDWDVAPMPDIDITNFAEFSYGDYAIYIAPELIKE